MNRPISFAFKATTLALAIVFSSIAPALGQVTRRSVGDTYGIGPEGTIGRGTAHQRGGPSDPGSGWGWRGSSSRTEYGSPYSGFSGSSTPGYTYSRGYSGNYTTPRTYSPPAASGPYLTSQYYEPGDGYRYPLYYNPATGAYFYYPVRR